MGEKGEFAIDLNDDVVRGSIVLQDGKMMWPPPAIEMPAPSPPKKTAVVKAAEQTPLAAAVSESGLTTGNIYQIKNPRRIHMRDGVAEWLGNLSR